MCVAEESSGRAEHSRSRGYTPAQVREREKASLLGCQRKREREREKQSTVAEYSRAKGIVCVRWLQEREGKVLCATCKRRERE